MSVRNDKAQDQITIVAEDKPRFMDSTETVAEQVFGVQAIHFLKLFGQVALRGIVAQHVPDELPDSVTAPQATAL